MSRILRMDLHLHTWGSFDCLSPPEDVLAAARTRGVDRIAITDHNNLEVAVEMAARYPTQVIPGEEVKTAEGVDVIGLYMKEEIPKGTPARETILEIRKQGGVAYLPHPFAPGKGGGGTLAEELAPLCHVVEVLNGRLRPMARNRLGAELALRHGRLRGAGSDAHTLGEVGGVWLEVSIHPNEPAAFLEALTQAREGGTLSPRRVHLASTWAKIRKRFPQ